MAMNNGFKHHFHASKLEWYLVDKEMRLCDHWKTHIHASTKFPNSLKLWFNCELTRIMVSKDQIHEEWGKFQDIFTTLSNWSMNWGDKLWKLTFLERRLQDQYI